MRNTIATIFLAALAGNACAGWTVIDTRDSERTYVDLDSARRSTGTSKIWTMLDYSDRQYVTDSVHFQSIVMLYEFDCVEQRKRILQSTMYEGAMRDGGSVYTSMVVKPWEYVQPGTIDDLKFKAACKK